MDIPDYEKMVDNLKAQYGQQGGVEPEKLGPTPHEVAMSTLNDWGVPLRSRKLVDDIADGKLSDTPFMQEVISFLGSPPGEMWCLTLASGVGAGKSTAAAYWLYRLAVIEENSRRKSTYWWSAGALARTDSYGHSYNGIIQAPFLVIDDLGTEHADKGGFMNSRIDEIVNYRYSNILPTVVTTNMNHRDFKVRYGERFVDRIKEGGVFYESGAKSMRGG